MKPKYYEKLPNGICVGAFPNPIESGIGRWGLLVVGEGGESKDRNVNRKNYGKYILKEIS